MHAPFYIIKQCFQRHICSRSAQILIIALGPTNKTYDTNFASELLSSTIVVGIYWLMVHFDTFLSPEGYGQAHLLYLPVPRKCALISLSEAKDKGNEMPLALNKIQKDAMTNGLHTNTCKTNETFKHC